MGGITTIAVDVAAAARRRPAVAAVGCFGAGIALHTFLPHHPVGWLCAALAVLLVTIALLRRSHLATSGLCGVLLLAGVCVAQVQRYQFPRVCIGDYTTDGQRLARLDVAIDEPPRWLVSPPGDSRPLPPRLSCLARVVAVETTGGWRACGGAVALRFEQPRPDLGPGQLLRVTGLLARPRMAMNPGEFDDASFERDRRVLASVRVPHADAVTILADRGPSIRVRLREKTRHLLAVGFAPERSFDLAFLRALLLGDSDPQLADVQDEFVRSGTLHQLSISGLHVAVLGGAVLLLARGLRVRPRAALLLAAAFVVFYATVALPSGAGVRAMLLGVAAAIGLVWRRSIDAIQLLAVSTFGVLLFDPADLHRGGFQVSLAAVLGLILFAGRAEAWVRRAFTSPDPGPIHPPPTTVGRAGYVWLRRYLWRALLAGAVAWVASVPLVAYQFEQVNLWSVPAGIVLLPFTLVALFGAALKVMLSLCWPSGSVAWAYLAALPVGAMRWTLRHLAHLPGAGLATAPPRVELLLACYAALALLLVPAARRRVKYGLRAVPVAAYALMLAFPADRGSPPGGVSVTLLSLGAGQCAVVRLANRHAVLVDCGSSTVPDVYRRIIGPYLRHAGVRTIDAIVLSHGDYDHISATAEAMAAYDDGPRVLMSPHFRRHAIGNEPAEALLDVLDQSGRGPEEVCAGDHRDLGGGASIDVLWPPRQCDMNSNNCGLVVKLTTAAGRTVLFPADIQEPPERELTMHPELIRSDVLVAPHHGSAEPTTAAFLAAVNAEVVLSSNDQALTHKQRAFEKLVTDVPLYRTHACGTITTTFDAAGQIEIDTFARGAVAVGPLPKQAVPAPRAALVVTGKR